MLRRFWKPAALVGAASFGTYKLWGNSEARATAFEKLQLSAETPIGIPLPPALNIPSRSEQIERLKDATKKWDILVIGGGATGSGVALDAASRGLSVALVEKDDFSSGTSSKSTKLIHGGVRYLEKAILNLDREQYKMVIEALSERSTLLKLAPHLAYELPIMLPVYNWYQLPYFFAGVKLYDLFSGKQAIQSSYILSKRKTLEIFPHLKQDELKGAIVYYDGAHNDARMNVSVALTAASEGAAIANHVEVAGLIKELDPATKTSKIIGARLRDTISGESWDLRTTVVVNATGPFSDTIRKMDDPSIQSIVCPSSGVHITLPDYYSPRNMGLLDPSTSDGRVIFFLPWENSTIAGTTDIPTTVSHNPKPSEAEIRFILKEISNYLSPDIKVRRGDVLAAWSGIRPLVLNPSKNATQELARNHIVHVSDSGLVTVAGGKWTTFRKMAFDTVEEVISQFKLKPKNACKTETLPLVGAHNYTPTINIQLIQQYGFETVVADHLAHAYGDRAKIIADMAEPTGQRWPAVGKRLSPAFPYIEAEVRYAVRHEMACTAVDVIARRLSIAFLNANAALDCVPRVIEIMAEELKWDKKKISQEMDDAHTFLQTMGLLDVKGHNFTSHQLVKFRNQFDGFDANNDGSISFEEFRTAIRNQNIMIAEEDLKQVFGTWDTDASGTLEFNEYVQLLGAIKEGRFVQLQALTQSEGLKTERSGGGV